MSLKLPCYAYETAKIAVFTVLEWFIISDSGHQSQRTSAATATQQLLQSTIILNYKGYPASDNDKKL